MAGNLILWKRSKPLLLTPHHRHLALPPSTAGRVPQQVLEYASTPRPPPQLLYHTILLASAENPIHLQDPHYLNQPLLLLLQFNPLSTRMFLARTRAATPILTVLQHYCHILTLLLLIRLLSCPRYRLDQDLAPRVTPCSFHRIKMLGNKMPLSLYSS